jgi:hypothetical protein
MTEKRQKENVLIPISQRPFYYQDLDEIIETFEEACKIKYFFSGVESFAHYFPFACCKHLAKSVKEVIKKKYNYEIKEFITWNANYGCPHALDYDPMLDVFIDLRENYDFYKKKGIYVSKNMPAHLESDNGGMVLYLKNENPLIERYKNHCNFPYFKRQITQLIDFHFKKYTN